MNHLIVSRVVALIAALFVVVAGLFAWIAAVQAPAENLTAVDIPHPAEEQIEDCAECHTVDEGTVPVTHRYYESATCGSCHRQARRVLVPHSVEMGDVRCPLCHSDPGRDHGMPANHLGYLTDECLLCHPVDPDRTRVQPQPAGLSRSPLVEIPHATTDFFEDCTACHEMGGRRPLPDNHATFSGEICLDCHEPEAEEPRAD